MTERARTDWFLLAGFSAFLFFWGLNYFGLIGADEPRYAQVAREMLARHDWITPTLGGKPWLEKPPLYYWQAMLAYRMFGVSDWTARLPSAWDALLLVFAVYLFLRRFRPGFHLDGALITAACAGLIGYARAASMDMALAASSTLALLAWYAWRETSHRGYLAIFYGLLALGMLAKGPVAPLLAALVIVVFAAIQRDLRCIWGTLWFPGIALFSILAFPWYVEVQVRNPQFFGEFIVQHNLARFGTDLYHHRQPFWYYLPVMLLALVPWTVFVIAAAVEIIRTWRGAGNSLFHSGGALNVFLLVWLGAPVIFFSFSQSKLPGYILPALPAGTVLVAEYVRRHVSDEEKVCRWLAILHAIVAALPVVPALLLQHILLEHRLAWGQGTILASVISLVLAAGIALTLISRADLRALRFVTLVAVVLTVAAILRIGGPALDVRFSARSLAKDITAMEAKPLPLAVLGVSREIEYGLAFYRNQRIMRYELGVVPATEHLLVAPETWRSEVARMAGNRRISKLGNFAPQHLDYYWVSAPLVGGESH